MPSSATTSARHADLAMHTATLRLGLRENLGQFSLLVLVNAFVFPAEVDRVLSPGGALVWVNSSGEQTPIYLSVEDLVAGLPGEWTGTSSRAGDGHWCVLRRA